MSGRVGRVVSAGQRRCTSGTSAVQLQTCSTASIWGSAAYRSHLEVSARMASIASRTCACSSNGRGREWGGERAGKQAGRWEGHDDGDNAA